MSAVCPNCRKATYAPTGQKVDLRETLRRWESETKTKFQPQTKAEYEAVGTTVFYQCAACRFGAFVPPAAGSANFYNDITVDSDYYVAEKWEFKKTFALMRAHGVNSLLDYGCGGGAFLKEAATHFPACRLDGYDKNPQAVAAFAGTKIGFVSDLEQHDGKIYDMITAFQILEHLDDPFSVLRTLKNSLKQGGLLIICVPNADGPIRHFTAALTEIPPHHVNRFNETSLRVYLQNENFAVEDVAFEPLPKILWESYLPVMLGKALPPSLEKFYHNFKGPGIVRRLIKLLRLTGLKALPLRGHSIYIVARKCAE